MRVQFPPRNPLFEGFIFERSEELDEEFYTTLDILIITSRDFRKE